MNDNRNYKFPKNSVSDREEYAIISSWIKRGSKVIDLGCGDGSLLKLLRQEKSIKGEGVEISPSAIRSATNKGLKVKQSRIDGPLDYKDNQFDYAICSVTLQMVTYPEVLIKEMKRISKKQIISFPNFAFILNRLDLLINGRMPRFCLFGYDWYSTGHFHQLSLRDFKTLCKDEGIKITEQYHLVPKIFSFRPKILQIFPNLFSITSVFLTK